MQYLWSIYALMCFSVFSCL